MVTEPREVLREFGTVLEEDVAVRVMDSTADCRYLVIPLPPADAASMSDDELMRCVTRNKLIGIER